METLLIATDFSDASRNASFYGVMLAKALGAKVVLLNVYPLIFPSADTAIMVTDGELKENSENRLKDEVNLLNPIETVRIETRSEQGNPTEIILLVAKEVKASWIIAGMKGTSRIARKVFGGTAFSLSRRSDVPLLLIPENAWFSVPKVIALASDINDKTDMHILDPLQEFGEKFNATMYIVRVIRKGMNEVFEMLLSPYRLKWHLKNLHPSYEFLNDNDVAHAMNEFVEEHKVDIIAMISQEHNLLERVFIKSDIKEMILHTQVPLLILPGKLSTTSSMVFDKDLEESIM